MNKTFFIRIALLIIAAIGISSCAGKATRGDSPQAGRAEVQTLAAAVRTFNVEARTDPVGKSQPPLTQEEVIAAIRAWDPSTRPVPEETFDRYQEIADTGKMPHGATLHSTRRWVGYRGFTFTVWWVDLSIRSNDGTGFTFRIRDRKLSSRQARPEDWPGHHRQNSPT